LASKPGDHGRHEVNVAGIKSIDVPNSWTQTTDSYLGGEGWCQRFHQAATVTWCSAYWTKGHVSTLLSRAA
jgi:hypothetical protein